MFVIGLLPLYKENMVELKFTAEKLNGQLITGSLSAESMREGKNKINRLAEKNRLKIKQIAKKIY